MTPRQRAAASLALLGVIAGLGTLYTLQSDGTHSVVPWDGERPAILECARYIIRAPSQTWDRLGLTPGATGYALAVVAYDPTTGEGHEPALPPEITALEDGEPYPCPDAPRLEVWEASSAPWPCACQRWGSSACEWLRPTPDGAEVWEPAPAETTLQSGRFRGDCQPTPCVGVAGLDPMHAACRPPQEPTP